MLEYFYNELRGTDMKILSDHGTDGACSVNPVRAAAQFKYNEMVVLSGEKQIRQTTVMELTAAIEAEGTEKKLRG